MEEKTAGRRLVFDHPGINDQTTSMVSAVVDSKRFFVFKNASEKAWSILCYKWDLSSVEADKVFFISSAAFPSLRAAMDECERLVNDETAFSEYCKNWIPGAQPL